MNKKRKNNKYKIIKHINTKSFFKKSKQRKKFLNKKTFFYKIGFLYKILFIILVLYFIYELFLQHILIISNDDIELSKLIKTDKSYTNESLDEILEKSKQFVNLTNMGILFTKIPKEIKNPKISVVIPVYNADKYIKKAVRSIQNQNFTNFEIILVDDVSRDNSVKIMEQLANEDSRIKIIKNNKNSGTLYSRCIGVLNAKGKYIFPLDNDDILLIGDLFSILYNEIEKSDVDIINYRSLNIWSVNDFFEKKNVDIIRDHKINYIMYQPKLSYTYRCIIWSQMLKIEVYKKVINLYGDRIHNFINFFEDCVINNIIYQVARSAKFLLKFGLLHINRHSSSSNTENKINKARGQMYALESYYDFSRFARNKKDNLVRQLNDLIKRGRFQLALKDEKTRLYVKSFIQRIYKDNKVSNDSKDMILNTCLKIKLINSSVEITG